jgi:hypothetical protein
MTSPTAVESSAPQPEQAPDWSPVPHEPVPQRPRRAGTVRRLALGGALAAVLWLLGHPVPAAVVVCAILLVSLLSTLLPVAGDRVVLVEQAVQRGAGRVLSTVLLGAVMLLVFAPVALVLRLLRHEPLALGQSPGDPSFWRPHVTWRRGPLHRRLFTYERLPSSAPAGRGLRLRAALGLILVAAFIDVVIGAAIDRFGDDPPQQGLVALTGADVPAGRGQPWRTLLPEITDAFEQERYDPYLGWKLGDYDGRHVTVRDGVRTSYQASGSDAPEALDVVFFGGSSLFGAFQRDEQTIVSQFARLAERDGIHLRVTNHGQPAYVAWQEMLMFSSLVSGGAKPDLAVFYDGFNELLLQFVLGPHRQPTHHEARDIEARLTEDEQAQERPARSLWNAWTDTSALYRLGRRLGVLPEREGPERTGRSLTTFWSGDQADRPERRGANASAIHRRGVELARRTAASYGVRSAFFWQPSVFTKRLVEGEEPLTSTVGADPEAWRAAARAARAGLAPGVVDLSTALDGMQQAVMYDFVHTNEAGARRIAAAVYARLQPQLLRLAEAKRR